MNTACLIGAKSLICRLALAGTIVVSAMTTLSVHAAQEITWDELIYTGFSLETAPVNEALDGTDVKLPGYVVPLEMDGEMVKEFLLVPYAGACIHTPPPPTNQIVHVIASEPFKSMMHRQPVWATGTMKVETSTNSVGYYNAESSYEMRGATVEVYQ